jgi:hypothetical protein
MITLRAQPNARSVGQPESAALGLLRWDLQPSRRRYAIISSAVRFSTRWTDAWLGRKD